MTPIDQASRYVAKCPPAVSGQDGHKTAFSVVSAVVNGFALSESEAFTVLASWNAACQPPWAEHELRHKIRDAINVPHDKPRGHKISNRGGTRVIRDVNGHPAAIVTPAKPKKPVTKKYDLQEDDLPESIADGARELLNKLFREGEGVRIAQGRLEEQKDGTFKEVPKDGGMSFSREEWLRKLAKHDGNPNGILKSSDKCGIFIGVNPYKVGCTKDADVIDFRHALIEFDKDVTLGEQLNLYAQMKLPAAAVIYSGGKSIHCWVRIDAQSRQEYDERVAILFEHFESAGFHPDDKNKNPGRFSRLPNCQRFDNRQELLALNPGASFTDWLRTIQDDELGACENFETLSQLDPTADPNCVIGFHAGKTTRYLCRGKAAWILGPSGIGKSTLMTDFAIPWALGESAYGISPGQPRKSLIIQAENDRYDLAEMVQGIGAGHNLSDFDETRWQQVKANVLFKTETRVTGQAFVDKLQRLVDRERPDIVWIDPMLAFMGIKVSEQHEVTNFLRTMLNPVLEATGVVLFGIHHTGKPPPAKTTANWTAIDYAYAGLGSSELVNWARAVLFLRPVSETDFELKLAKRGGRAKATHPDGVWTTSLWLRHASEGIRWEQVPPPAKSDDREDDGEPKKEKLTKPEQVNRALGLSFFNAIPEQGEGLRALVRRLTDWMTCSEAKPKMVVSKGTGERAVELMLTANKIKCSNGVYIKGPNA